jgi:uncharacterized membrane protein YhaH (DUF805 family)
MNADYVKFWYVWLIILLISYVSLRKVLFVVKKRALKDVKFKNDLLAFAYLIISIGPNVSAFSIVELLISSNNETKITLIFVFMAGIFLYYLGRRLRDYIAIKTSKAYEEKEPNALRDKVMGVKNKS